MALHQKAPAQRLGWIDSAKGIGIVLVVIGHGWRGLQTAGLIRDPALYHAIDSAIYAFHMPFFFFLSGILIERALLGSSGAAFVVSRTQRLIWPLVLWTWIFFLFKGLAGGLANKPSDWSNFPIFPLPPHEHFWFLWALFVIQLSLLLARPLLKSPAYRPQVWILLWLASVAVFLAGPNLEPYLGALSVWVGQAIAYAPYFMLGAAAAGWRHARPSILGGGLAFVAFLAVVAADFVLPQVDWARLMIGCAATALLCLTVMALEQPVFARPAFRWVEGLGVASLAIYVSHTIFSAATRIVLLKVGIVDLWVHMGIGTLIGLLCPVALLLAARRAGMAGKLGF